MSECYCNEGGICPPCFDSKCDESRARKKEIERLNVFISEIVAAIGDPYDTALHLTIGGMIERFNKPLEIIP